ncbi:PREDICTED: peroxisomal membrane protein 2 [Nicrophorus vespilloides]|uniref:Peroxisomal membrane protein 2 n=1 Tax=Nicrophorus vespilloides TaxID=110193 RepID=A0ABM1M3V7_NICVS|nr:PREDICTED: peroxisomal membrane protein 2 [Nicrophorus vespilloides]
MVLSKPLYDFLGFYFSNLFNNPIKTKAISCCVIASAGNLASQYLAGNKILNQRSLLAYALFGLLFGGTIPHYFYGFLERTVNQDASFAIVKNLVIERLIYSPLYQAFSLYMIARLEGKSHKEALVQLQSLYWTVLASSWKYLTLIQMLNLSVVPPMLRVLIANLIGFFWTIYIANKRREQQKKSKKQ